jgi:hypothetical protein
MNFKSKEIKESISKELGSFLSQDNFVYKKTSNEFVSEVNEFSFIFNILLTAWSDHYSLDVRLYISHKKVEMIFEEILGKKSYKLTIGDDIERIFKSPDGKLVVQGNMSILLLQSEDIEAAIETLKGYYVNIAKPYFKRYHSLDAIHDIINNPPFEHCPAHVGGRLDHRCMKGLIIARLVNSSDYEQLVMTYDEAIKRTMNQDSIENYYKVREYLIYNLPSSL